MSKKYLDYAGLKRVLAKLLPGARKIWHGTLAEWEALSDTEKNKYDQAEIVDTEEAENPNSDLVKSGDNRPLTSGGMAKFLNTVGSAGHYSPWYTYTTNGWHNNQTAIIQNVSKGKYLVIFAVMAEFGGNGYVCGSCQGGNNMLSAYSDVFATYAMCPYILTVNADGNVSVPFNFYTNGGATTRGHAQCRVGLIKLRDIA